MQAHVYFNEDGSDEDKERYWVDGRIFRLLIRDDGSSSKANEETRVKVGWFGQNSNCHVIIPPGPKVAVDVHGSNRVEIDTEKWIDSVCAELSDSVRQVASDVVHMAKSEFGVLLKGSHGTGKTMLLEALGSAYAKQFLSNTGDGSMLCIVRESAMLSVDDINRTISTIDNCQGIIILDDVDRIVPAKKLSGLDSRRAHLLIRSVKRARTRRVIIIGSTANSERVDSNLVTFGGLDRSVTILAPTFSERRVQLIHRNFSDDEVDTWIAQRTGGWTRAELDSFARAIANAGATELSRIALMLSQARRSTTLYRESSVVPPSIELEDEEAANPSPEFAPRIIGGLAHVRSLLNRAVVSFLRSDSHATRGVFLHGPSGNGKTLLGMTLGAHVQHLGLANFVCIRCLDLVSKVVGETESNVARVFARARDCAPCVLFLDQIEALAPKRTAESETAERTFEKVLSVLLVEMDGILTKSFAGKMVIMAASRNLADVEPALIRPGRLGTHIFVGQPDSIGECIEVLRNCTRSTPLAVGEDFFENELAPRLRTKSRAEIANLAREAATLAIRESIESQCVTEAHFLRALGA